MTADLEKVLGRLRDEGDWSAFRLLNPEQAHKFLGRTENGWVYVDGAFPVSALTAQPTDEVRAALADFDAADWTDCFPQGGECRDLLAAAYGLPSMKEAVKASR